MPLSSSHPRPPPLRRPSTPTSSPFSPRTWTSRDSRSSASNFQARDKPPPSSVALEMYLRFCMDTKEVIEKKNEKKRSGTWYLSRWRSRVRVRFVQMGVGEWRSEGRKRSVRNRIVSEEEYRAKGQLRRRNYWRQSAGPSRRHDSSAVDRPDTCGRPARADRARST